MAWNGILKIIECNHLSANGDILWQSKDIKNILHVSGEQFILDAIFVGELEIPAYYYFGLDNRTDLDVTDELDDLLAEPTGNGYTRRPVASTGAFTLDVTTGGHYRALSSRLTFSASGSGYGPVKNLFLATSIDDSGLLISSIALGQTLTLASSESFNIVMGLSLGEC